MVTPIANVKLTLGDLIPEEGTVIYMMIISQD